MIRMIKDSTHWVAWRAHFPRRILERKGSMGAMVLSSLQAQCRCRGEWLSELSTVGDLEEGHSSNENGMCMNTEDP